MSNEVLFDANIKLLRPIVTCDNCSGNTGYYDRANGERHLSDPEDGTPWQKCQECDGTGRVNSKNIVMVTMPPVMMSVDTAQMLASFFLSLAVRHSNKGWDDTIDAVLKEAVKARGL